MARTLITGGDTIVVAGEGHPNFPDDQTYLREIWADYTEEHEVTGAQKSPYETWALHEPGTYAGTGAALSVDWTGTTYTGILMLLIWSENDGELYVTTTGGYTKQASDGAVLTNAVTAIDTDGFTLGTNAGVNTNAITYQYVVFAIGTTPDAGSNASPPTWIPDGTVLEGGDVTKNGNSVETNLDTKFLVKHTIDTGAHDDSEFDDLMTGETGTFTPDGTVSQILTLAKTNLDVRAFWLWDTGTGGYNKPAFMGENFAKLREYPATALTGTGYVTLGTGQVGINTAKMRSSATTILDINSNTTDGDETIVDSSAYAATIYNPLASGWQAVAHYTTYAHTGASSIRFGGAAHSAFTVDYSPTLWKSFVFSGNFEIQCELLLPAAVATGQGNFFYIYGYNPTTNALTHIMLAVDIVAGDHVIQANLIDDTGAEVEITDTTDLDDTAFHNISLSRTSGVVDLQVDSVSAGTGALFGNFYPLLMQVGRLGGYSVTSNEVAPVLDGQYWYLDDIQVDVVLPYFDRTGTYRYVAIGEE